MTVAAELNDKGRIDVYFPYDSRRVAQIKMIAGRRWLKEPKDGTPPHWTIPCDVDGCRQLRAAFGDELVLGPALRRWGHRELATVMRLVQLANADDAELDICPKLVPELCAKIAGIEVVDHMENTHVPVGPDRPYQRADIKFMGISPAPLNSNQPGLGKTIEAIGGVYEGETHIGPKLVVAPVSSLEVVWWKELTAWQDEEVIVATGGKYDRQQAVTRAWDLYCMERSFWVVCNPAMIQYRRSGQVDETGQPILFSSYPELHDIQWQVCIIDEFHKMGLGNTQTLTAKAMFAIKANKRMALSGTPIQGKPIKLYGILHFLHPDVFKSKWKFAEQWLVITEDQYGKAIHGIRPEREEAFYDMLSQYLVRRTKAEVLTQLPPKQYVEIWAEMEGEQAQQYKQFALEAEMKIEDEQLSATSILAEYTRLKQFADAAQSIERRPDGTKKLHGKMDKSCKIPHLLEILSERGIAKTGSEEEDGDEQVVVFSQFSEIVDATHKYLLELGIPAEKFTGATTPTKRAEIITAFQDASGPRVLLMTTTAGGVSVTLDRASTVVFLDETWTPDDQEQAEDRVHRGSRIHQVTVYYIRSRKTIEEYIMRRVGQKAEINYKILDLRREGLRADRDSV